MNVSVMQENLARGLQTVSRAVSSRATLPVLANVLLKTENSGLKLTATNLEIGINSWVPGKVAEEGPVRQVFTVPRHPYTQKLLSSFPNIRADRRTLDVIPGTPPDLRHPPIGCPFAARCPAVMPVCTEVMPPEVTFADGVRVACHLYPPEVEGRLVAPVPVATPVELDAAPAPEAGPPVGAGTAAADPLGIPEGDA